jgi:hypothetical protein
VKVMQETSRCMGLFDKSTGSETRISRGFVYGRTGVVPDTVQEAFREGGKTLRAHNGASMITRQKKLSFKGRDLALIRHELSRAPLR